MATKKKKAKKSSTKVRVAAKAKKKKAIKKAAKKPAKKKPTKKVATKKASPPKKVAKGSRLGPPATADIVTSSFPRRGLGADSGGQSGDTQGLSEDALGDSESVSELLEEGQSFEAEVVRGVENAPDADQGEVRTHEVPEDDVPEEYRERDE